MGRDTFRYRQLDKEREMRGQINPIWRGVGCLIIAGFSVGGYFFAGWFVRANATNGWINLPYEAYNPDFAPFLGDGLLLRLIIAFLFLLLSYGLLSFIYALLFPIKPTEVDASPPRRRPNRPRRRKS
ncbi:MAG: hypothetical protein P1P76_07895 [Anaerolineales bacterium]|nr:hypothetical protein [Anaerolineales bacterium]